MKNWEMLMSEAKPPDCTRTHVSRVIQDKGLGVCYGELLFSDFVSLRAPEIRYRRSNQKHTRIEFD